MNNKKSLRFNWGSNRGVAFWKGSVFVGTFDGRLIALDAKTGAILWEYDPKVQRSWAKKLCCDVVNRGVAVYRGRFSQQHRV